MAITRHGFLFAGSVYRKSKQEIFTLTEAEVRELMRWLRFLR